LPLLTIFGYSNESGRSWTGAAAGKIKVKRKITPHPRPLKRRKADLQFAKPAPAVAEAKLPL